MYPTTSRPLSGRRVQVTTPDDDCAVHVLVAPVGRLDGSRSETFRRRLALLSVLAGADVVVDLGAVPVVDEAAAQSLLDAASRLRGSSGRLTIERPRVQPRQMLLGQAAPNALNAHQLTKSVA